MDALIELIKSLGYLSNEIQAILKILLALKKRL